MQNLVCFAKKSVNRKPFLVWMIFSTRQNLLNCYLNSEMPLRTWPDANKVAGTKLQNFQFFCNCQCEQGRNQNLCTYQCCALSYPPHPLSPNFIRYSRFLPSATSLLLCWQRSLTMRQKGERLDLLPLIFALLWETSASREHHCWGSYSDSKWSDEIQATTHSPSDLVHVFSIVMITDNNIAWFSNGQMTWYRVKDRGPCWGWDLA